MLELLQKISDKWLRIAQGVAATGRMLIGWDNLNFASSIAEQRYGKSGTLGQHNRNLRTLHVLTRTASAF